MSNRINRVVPKATRLNPAEAELCFSITPEHLTLTTQIRGRLTGPRCPYASTVEVAYAIREQSRASETEVASQILVRVVIPEPNFWDPVSPFLYEGALELWEADECRDRWPVRQGLRALDLGPRGLRCNQKPLPLSGVRRDCLTEADARRLHDSGVNTVLAREAAPELEEMADRFGFLVIHRLNSRKDMRRPTLQPNSTSRLGWLMSAEMLNDPLMRAALPFPGVSVGVELTAPLAEPLPAGICFIACTEEVSPRLDGVALPRILLAEQPGNRTEGAGVIGHIAG